MSDVIRELLPDKAPYAGHLYKVPCIGFLPIIGPPHYDKTGEFFFAETPEHYHIDSRFVNFTVRVVPVGYYGFNAPIEMRTMKCLRSYPLDWSNEGGTVGLMLMALHLDFGFGRPSKCNICPHKGMPIQNGICTGHRLQWLPSGEILHAPPYTLVIEGTRNKVVISERQEQCSEIGIPIVQLPQPGLPFYVLKMYDSIMGLVAQYKFRAAKFELGTIMKFKSQ